MMDDTRKKRLSFSHDAERIWNRSRKLGFYLRLGGLFSLQSSSSIPTRGGHSCARTPRALPLAAPCAPPGVPKRSALSVRGQPAEPSRVGRFCEGHLPRRWKVPACVNALTRKPYALLSGTMVFAAQELLRDNLSTPQNVKFAGAFPTPGSARAPLGRARRGAATVGVARTTRFFIPRRRWQPITAPDFQPNAFCHFSPKHPRRQIADPRSRPRRARCLF